MLRVSPTTPGLGLSTQLTIAKTHSKFRKILVVILHLHKGPTKWPQVITQVLPGTCKRANPALPQLARYPMCNRIKVRRRAPIRPVCWPDPPPETTPLNRNLRSSSSEQRAQRVQYSPAIPQALVSNQVRAPPGESSISRKRPRMITHNSDNYKPVMPNESTHVL